MPNTITLRYARKDCLDQVVEALRSFRQNKGLGQAAVSVKAGFSHITYHQIERKTRPPTLDNVIRFMDALGMVGRERERVLWWLAMAEISDDRIRNEIIRIKRALVAPRPHGPPASAGRRGAPRHQAHRAGAPGRPA
jgi:transcriptional regulator with XRE-family HTH domain